MNAPSSGFTTIQDSPAGNVSLPSNISRNPSPSIVESTSMADASLSSEFRIDSVTDEPTDNSVKETSDESHSDKAIEETPPVGSLQLAGSSATGSARIWPPVPDSPILKVEVSAPLMSDNAPPTDSATPLTTDGAPVITDSTQLIADGSSVPFDTDDAPPIDDGVPMTTDEAPSIAEGVASTTESLSITNDDAPPSDTAVPHIDDTVAPVALPSDVSTDFVHEKLVDTFDKDDHEIDNVNRNEPVDFVMDVVNAENGPVHVITDDISTDEHVGPSDGKIAPIVVVDATSVTNSTDDVPSNDETSPSSSETINPTISPQTKINDEVELKATDQVIEAPIAVKEHETAAVDPSTLSVK